MLRLLKRSEIDDRRWDDCILHSHNSVHYPMSWYLDIVSSGWQGVIYGDYEAVMPVPIKKKMGMSLILQPFLTQQLGVFSSEILSPDILTEFYLILKKWNLVVYNVNLTDTSGIPSGLQLSKLPNIELALNKEYSDLSRAFSKNTRRNISKTKRSELIIKGVLPDEKVFSFIFNNLRFPYSAKEVDIFKKVVLKSFSRDEGELIACMNNSNEVIAIGFFVTHKNRITFLGSSSSEEGYDKQAAFLIFDNVIEKYSNKDFILDFEGSKNEGIARFYRGFGGDVTEYGVIKSNLHSLMLLLNKINKFLK